MQHFLPETLSKFNATVHSGSLIECKIKHIVKKICGPFTPCHHSLLAPFKITQCYDQDTVELDFSIPSVLSVYVEHIAIQTEKKFQR